MSLECFHCSYSTDYKSNLRRHIERNHTMLKGNETLRLLPPKISCLMCEHKSNSRPQMSEHYSQAHDVDCSVKCFEFDNINTFEEWKSLLEAKERSLFIKMKTARRSNKSIRQSFVCHRDGSFQSRGEGKRRLKRLGSNKIGGFCPSQMNLTLDINSGTVTVKYISTHVGHSHDLGRLPLLKSDRQMIAQKLAAGVGYQKIINDIRDTVSGNHQRRLHLVTRQDIANVARDYNFSSPVIRHAASVDSWVAETQNSSNIVRFYKPQGRSLPGYPALAYNDFVLILANDYQVRTLTEHGKNVICLDATHGTESYDFELTTLLTVNEKHKAFPCFYMFSNRSDSNIMAIFARVVKDALGHELLTSSLMSDMSEIYINGWCSVMPTPNHLLYCSWDVQRAWSENLSKIKDAGKRVQVYKQLKILQEEADENAFSTGLRAAIAEFTKDPATEDFGNYFASEYGQNCDRWAYSHRKHCGVNTTMFLESVHNTLKYIYLKGKKIKLLDKCIHAVMEFTRDKSVDHGSALRISDESFPLNDREASTMHQIAVEKPPCESFEKRLQSLDDFYLRIRSELKTHSDIEMVESLLKSAFPTIHSTNDAQQTFFCSHLAKPRQ